MSNYQQVKEFSGLSGYDSESSDDTKDVSSRSTDMLKEHSYTSQIENEPTEQSKDVRDFFNEVPFDWGDISESFREASDLGELSDKHALIRSTENSQDVTLSSYKLPETSPEPYTQYNNTPDMTLFSHKLPEKSLEPYTQDKNTPHAFPCNRPDPNKHVVFAPHSRHTNNKFFINKSPDCEMNYLTIVQLRKLLKYKGLRVTGLKADLVLRLSNHLKEEGIDVNDWVRRRVPEINEIISNQPKPLNCWIHGRASTSYGDGSVRPKDNVSDAGSISKGQFVSRNQVEQVASCLGECNEHISFEPKASQYLINEGASTSREYGNTQPKDNVSEAGIISKGQNISRIHIQRIASCLGEREKVECNEYKPSQPKVLQYRVNKSDSTPYVYFIIQPKDSVSEPGSISKGRNISGIHVQPTASCLGEREKLERNEYKSFQPSVLQFGVNKSDNTSFGHVIIQPKDSVYKAGSITKGRNISRNPVQRIASCLGQPKILQHGVNESARTSSVNETIHPNFNVSGGGSRSRGFNILRNDDKRPESNKSNLVQTNTVQYKFNDGASTSLIDDNTQLKNSVSEADNMSIMNNQKGTDAFMGYMLDYNASQTENDSTKHCQHIINIYQHTLDTSNEDYTESSDYSSEYIKEVFDLGQLSD